MTFFDTADLPRASFLRDPSRRYKSLSYNCDYTPQPLICRPLPPRRDSAVATSLRFARSAASRNPPITMPISLSPFTIPDIPTAIILHSNATTNDPVELATHTLLSSSEKTAARTHEWALALQNPFTKTIKATTSEGTLIGAAGFLTHEVDGRQWSTASRREGAGSVEKEIDDRLSQARGEVLGGGCDVWHIYLAFVDPVCRDTSAWSDMISWGLSQADEAGKACYVQASLTERVTYEKLGFEVKKVVELPEEGKATEEGNAYLRYLMLRPAKRQCPD